MKKNLFKRIYEDIKYATSIRESPQYIRSIVSSEKANEIIITVGIEDREIRLERRSFLLGLKEEKKLLEELLK